MQGASCVHHIRIFFHPIFVPFFGLPGVLFQPLNILTPVNMGRGAYDMTGVEKPPKPKPTINSNTANPNQSLVDKKTIVRPSDQRSRNMYYYSIAYFGEFVRDLE